MTFYEIAAPGSNAGRIVLSLTADYEVAWPLVSVAVLGTDQIPLSEREAVRIASVVAVAMKRRAKPWRWRV